MASAREECASIARLVAASCAALGLDEGALVRKVTSAAEKGAEYERVSNIAAREAMAMALEEVGYGDVARDVIVAQIRRAACATVLDVAREAREEASSEYVEFCTRHAAEIGAAIKPERDALFDAVGLTVLAHSYLWARADGSVAETPQLMLMRVAIAVSDTIEDALENYDMMSLKRFTHASPTLFNAGCSTPQMSSCYVIHPGAGTAGVLKAQFDAGVISMHAGGIGLSIHSQSFRDDVLPICKAYESTMEIAEQGGGKRMGRMCVYTEPCNPHIRKVLKFHKNDGSTDESCHNIYTAIWVDDEFMRRVEADAEWTFVPDDALREELCGLHGDAYAERYRQIERENPHFPKIGAMELMTAIATAQAETGRPYLLYKDHANAKSNQGHLGTIKSSNLCTEIMIHTDKDNTAVCNLASVVLQACVADGRFDFDALAAAVRRVVKNLNTVIDKNFYPTEEARRSNTHGRPIGIGAQGLQDVFYMLELPFDSEEAKLLNREIFETIYFWAAWESCEIARAAAPGAKCPAFAGSPASKGVLSHQMWGVDDEQLATKDRLNWSVLRTKVQEEQMANTLLVALMPTASTSVIMGSCAESIEPITYHVMTRKLLSGETTCINRHLVEHLKARGLWSPAMLGKIIERDGMVGDIEDIPDDTKRLFRTAWEISLREQVDLTAGRAPFVDQSQSTNVFLAQPTVGKLLTYHMLAWKRGLKTSMYYLRQRPKQRQTQFAACSLGCESCSA